MTLVRKDNKRKITHVKDAVPVLVPIREAVKLDPPEDKVRFEIDQDDAALEPEWALREAELDSNGERVFVDEEGYEIPESMVTTEEEYVEVRQKAQHSGGPGHSCGS